MKTENHTGEDKKPRGDGRAKEAVIDILKGIVKSEIFAFIAFAVATIPINLFVYGEDYESERDMTPVYIIIFFIYLAVNYVVYIKKAVSREELDVRADKFDFAADLKKYVSGDGKYILAIYGVLAVIFEISLLANFMPVATALVFMFPVGAIITVPVLRTVVSYVLLAAALLLVTEFERHRAFKYWNGEK